MKKEITIHGMKVNGKTNLLKQCKFFIYTWDGYAERLFKAKDILSSKIHISWFEQADKGGPSLFGVDKNGAVVCSLLYYHEKQSSGLVTGIDIESDKKANPWL